MGEQFEPHGYCFLWDPGLVGLNVSSDMLIGLSYLAISSTLAYLYVRARRDIPFGWVVVAFGLFIVACGGTHFMEVWTLWHPDYWASGGLKAVTAAASVVTALALVPLVPRVLQLIDSAKLSERRRLRLEARNAELQAVSSRLQAVLGSMGTAVITLDADQRITEMNPAAERLTGFGQHEARGQVSSDLLSIPTAQRAVVLQTLRTGQAGAAHEKVILTKAGTFRCTEATTAALRDAAGAVVGSVQVFTDLTERKQAEATLLASNDERRQAEAHVRSLNATLEQRVAERTARLDQQAVMLTAANQELEAFAYSVSHDLRTPLRGISGFSQALLAGYGDRLDAVGRDHLERVLAGTRRMSQLIDDLLDLSRLTRAELRVQPLDLSALAAEVVAELRRQDPERSVAVTIAPDLRASGDRGQLRALLDNLLANAWKFTAYTDQPTIALGAAPRGATVAYYVRDNGAGFDMAYSAKLFGAFQRLHSAKQFAGTGIGLATVARIVHRHGGRVWAEGAPDHGATFWFTLAAPPAAAPQDHQRASA